MSVGAGAGDDVGGGDGHGGGGDGGEGDGGGGVGGSRTTAAPPDSCPGSPHDPGQGARTMLTATSSL